MISKNYPVVAGFSSLALLAAVSCTEKMPQKPNILLIITDQQSAEALSFNLGEKYLRTPNMDYLAGHGVVFTNSYCANPLSIPSRSSMFTGRYPHEVGLQWNDNRKIDPAEFKCLGRVFSDAGYETGYTGKWHLPYDQNKTDDHGFFFMKSIRNNGIDSLIPGSAREFLHKKRDKPFLLVASFVNPHNICEWARGQRLPDGNIGTPPFPGDCPPLRNNHSPSADESGIMKLMRRSYQSAPMFPVSGFTDDKWRQYAWAYYRMIEKADGLIGEILKDLRETGAERNTIVVFLSDHGDCQGAHRWNQKTVFFEESARVPFIVSSPMIRPGRSEFLVQTGIDLMPTLCDLAGIEVSEMLPGTSLKPMIFGKNRSHKRDYVVVSNHMVQGDTIEGYKPEPEGRMLRTGRFKYWIMSEGNPGETLYDLQNDPGEMINIARDPEYSGDLEKCRTILKEWARENNDTFFERIINQ